MKRKRILQIALTSLVVFAPILAIAAVPCQCYPFNDCPPPPAGCVPQQIGDGRQQCKQFCAQACATPPDPNPASPLTWYQSGCCQYTIETWTYYASDPNVVCNSPGNCTKITLVTYSASTQCKYGSTG